MNVLVVGATPPVLRQLRMLAASVSSRLDLFDDRGPVRADWVIAATSAQRAAAIDAHRLPPHRVLEMPALASASELSSSEAFVRAGLATIAGIGVPGPNISRAGVSLTRVMLRWFRGAVERAAQRADLDSFEFSDDVPWPPTATKWTSGESAEPKNRVVERIPVGRELDDILEHQTRKRAKRFAALAEPS